MDYQNYHKYVDDVLPSESPILYGLHPNAEIGLLTNQADNLFKMILELQPRDFGTSGMYGMSRDDKVYFLSILYLPFFFFDRTVHFDVVLYH